MGSSVAGGSGMPSPDEAAAAEAASAAGPAKKSAKDKKPKEPSSADSRAASVAGAAVAAGQEIQEPQAKKHQIVRAGKGEKQALPLDAVGRIASFGGLRMAAALGQVVSTPPRHREAAGGGAAAAAAASTPETAENIFWSEALRNEEAADAAAAKFTPAFIKAPRGFRFPAFFNEGVRAEVRHLHLKNLGARITPDILRALREYFPNLISLELGGWGINDEACQIIATGWPNLQSLDLPNCAITDAGCAHLAALKKLETLRLAYDDINRGELYCTAQGLASLASMTTLKNLILGDCRSISLDAFASLRSLVELCSLEIRTSLNMTVDGLSTFLPFLTKLEALSLHCCKELGDETLAYLGGQRALQNQLRSLDLSLIRHRFSPEGLSSLRQFTRLEQLNLYCCSIGDRQLQAVTANCPHLRELTLGQSDWVTEAGFAHLRNCQHLAKLKLCGCSNMNDTVLQALGVNCPNLRELDISMSERITDAGVAHLRGCTHLEKLNLSNVSYNVTDATLKSLAKNCPNLREINLSYCTGITQAGIDALQRAFGEKLKIIREAPMRLNM